MQYKRILGGHPYRGAYGEKMKKFFSVFFIFSNFFFCFAEDFHHKYIFYKFEHEIRLQAIIINLFNEHNKKIKTIETYIPYNEQIYTSEEIDYEYINNQIIELKNGNKIHSYKINNENEIIEEYFYTDNEIDIVNTVKYEYENKRLSKKKSFVFEYNYFYNKNGDLIEIVDNQNNRKVFKYKRKNNRIIQERLIQKQGKTEDIRYTKNIFYNIEARQCMSSLALRGKTMLWRDSSPA